MEFAALHEKAQRCAEQYRRNEAELIGLLQQIDPTQGYKKKAERAQARKPTPILSQGQTGRYVPAHVAHQVSLPDRGQCTFTGAHGKCRESRWTDVHHVTPVSRGGTSTLDNLTTLCASHHRYLHAQPRRPATHDHRRVPSAAGRMAGNDPLSSRFRRPSQRCFRPGRSARGYW